MIPLIPKFNKKCKTKKPMFFKYKGLKGKTFNLKFGTKDVLK